jgi:hypothetical protein
VSVHAFPLTWRLGDGLRDKRIAVLSPVARRTQPRTYRTWQTAASNVAKGLSDADEVMCAGTTIIDELADACLTYSRPAMRTPSP